MTLTPAQQRELASWPEADRDEWSERAAYELIKRRTSVQQKQPKGA